MMRFLLSFVLVSLGLITSLFTFGAHAGVDNAVTKKAVAEFNQGKAVLLDVRENDEVAQGRVKGALVFPKSRIGTPDWTTFVASLNKDKPIYVYCRSGRRSEEVVTQLKKLGFHAENAGGLNDLKREGAETQ